LLGFVCFVHVTPGMTKPAQSHGRFGAVAVKFRSTMPGATVCHRSCLVERCFRSLRGNVPASPCSRMVCPLRMRPLRRRVPT
jgi:hypothetical protein